VSEFREVKMNEEISRISWKDFSKEKIHKPINTDMSALAPGFIKKNKRFRSFKRLISPIKGKGADPYQWFSDIYNDLHSKYAPEVEDLEIYKNAIRLTEERCGYFFIENML